MKPLLKPITTLEEWREFKKTLVFSTITCFVCRDKLYYGNRFIQKKTKNPVFHCKCGVGLMKEDKCSICHTPVTYNTIRIPMQMLRCTCGHTAGVEVSKLDTVDSI